MAELNEMIMNNKLIAEGLSVFLKNIGILIIMIIVLRCRYGT